MKISNYPDLRKSIEITTTETDDSEMNLQGDTLITSKHRDTGEASTVGTITQHGSMDLIQRPTVGGVPVALSTDGSSSLQTIERTIADNVTTLLVLLPVQELVTVLYSIQNSSCNEKGEITIIETNTGYELSTRQRAESDFFADIQFGVSESNGSLILHVIGQGTGLITDFKYRVNSVNTLYI